MPTAFFALLISHLLAVCFAKPVNIPQDALETGASLSSQQSEPTPVEIATTVDGTAITETFLPTSLSEFATLTAATTITTTDLSGAALVAAILPGGLALLPFLPGGAVPPVEPPLTDPLPEPTDRPAETATETTSTSSSTPKSQPTRAVFRKPDNWDQIMMGPDIQIYSNDVHDCGFQDNELVWMARDTGSAIIDTFCKKYNNTVVTVGSPVSEQFEFGTGLVLNITISQNEVCADDKNQKITTNECTTLVHQALDDCDTKSMAQKFGGTIDNACFKYILRPQFDDVTSSCTGTSPGTGVNRDEAISHIEDFCNKNDGVIINSSNVTQQGYNPVLGESTALLSVSYSGDCPTDGGPSYLINSQSCQHFLGKTIDLCNTDAGRPYGKYGGTVPHKCANFKFGTHKGAKCNVDDVSGLPSNVFQGVYDQFCGAVHQSNEKRAWVVDTSGNQIPIKKQPVQERSSPPDPGAFNFYRISLIWEPNENPNCEMKCAEAFDYLSNSQCGHTGGEQNVMSHDGQLELSCGTYSYVLDGQIQTPPSLGVQQCQVVTTDKIGTDVRDLKGFAEQFCKDWAIGSLGPDDSTVAKTYTSKTTQYDFSVSWVGGCKTEIQDLGHPLEGDDSTTCLSLLTEDYTSCNNGGFGGWRNAGCARYEFLASPPK